MILKIKITKEEVQKGLELQVKMSAAHKAFMSAAFTDRDKRAAIWMQKQLALDSYLTELWDKYEGNDLIQDETFIVYGPQIQFYDRALYVRVEDVSLSQWYPLR